MGKNIQLQYNGEMGYAATIEDVVKNIFQIYAISAEEFLDYSLQDLPSNREHVFDYFPIQEKIKYGLADENGNITKTFKDVTSQMMCPRIVFNIDSKYVNKNTILSNSNLLTDDYSESSVNFTPDGEDESKTFLLQDGTVFKDNVFFYNKIAYQPRITKNNPDNYGAGDLITRRQYLNPRVWIWSKSLNEKGEFNTNSIFDLSPFIHDMEFSNSETGGQFSLSLINIEGFIETCEDGESIGVWKVRKDRYFKFKKDSKINYLFKNVLNARFSSSMKHDNSFTQNEDSNYSLDDVNKRITPIKAKIDKSKMNNAKDSISSDLFFKNLISENDIIFMTFRDDEENQIETVDDFFISNDKLPDRNWDMIGLVDRNSVGLTYESDEHDITISGRDCMKLLIEDGSYFFANSYSNDEAQSIFQNMDLPNRGDSVNTSNKYTQEGSKSFNRVEPTGVIENLYQPNARNVKFIMNLLISTLSNIEICHTRLFEFYKNKTQFQIPKFETVKQEE